MPFNGSGTFQRIYSWVTDQANGLQVNATRMDTDTNDIANGLSQCVTKDGQSGALTANLQMGSHKITGLSNGTASTDAVNFGQVFTAPTFTAPAIVGATLTGTIDASGATSVLVPTPTLSGQAVNLSTMTAALASGSPAPVWVSGTTYTIGQIVYSPITFLTYRRKVAGAGTTDPSLDSTNWQVQASTIGTGGQTITGNYTFTSASPAAITVTPSAPGQYLTFDDARNFTKADNLVAVYNAGDYDYGVKDGAGTQLGWIRARTGMMAGLSDNTTAAGVWAYYGLEKTGITASYVNSTLANMGTTIRRIALDANRTCFLFGGTDCYAIVYDASSQTWGSATLVRATIASGAFVGILSATNQVLVVSSTAATGTMQAVTLTIATNTVTVNSPVTAAAGAIAFSTFSQIIAIGSSWVVGYGSNTNNARAITVSGTVPTISAETVVTSGTSTGPNLYASGSVVRAVTVSATTVACTPYTVSGTTLTPGTAATATTTAASFRAFLNGNGNIVCHYINTTHFATIFKLTGTVEAASSVSLGTAPSSITGATDYVSVSASKTAFFYSASSSVLYANILTDTAGTATAGTEFSQNISPNAMASVAYVGISGNLARCSFASQLGNGTIGHVVLDCSGTSLSLSAVATIQNSNFNFGASLGSAAISVASASDQYGIRSGTLLFAGNSTYVPSPAGQSYGLAFYSSGLLAATKTTPLLSPAAQAFSAIPGGSNNESFSKFTIFSTTGFAIQRVEAAA